MPGDFLDTCSSWTAFLVFLPHGRPHEQAVSLADLRLAEVQLGSWGAGAHTDRTHLKRPWTTILLRRRLPFHMSSGAVGRSRTQMAAAPMKLSVSNWIGLHQHHVSVICGRYGIREQIASHLLCLCSCYAGTF